MQESSKALVIYTLKLCVPFVSELHSDLLLHKSLGPININLPMLWDMTEHELYTDLSINSTWIYTSPEVLPFHTISAPFNVILHDNCKWQPHSW